MRSFTRVVVFILIAFGGLMVQSAKAQVANTDTVLNPNDPIIDYDANSPPADPPAGKIVKWVRTPRLGWNTSEYKSYFYGQFGLFNGVCFRLKFPKTYNPSANDGKRYPMLVFFHGLGEVAGVYDNEFHLYHGAAAFQTAVDNGTYDGYVLFMQSQGGWSGGHYNYIKEIIDYMVNFNKLDPFQISVNGLSAGGQASWEFHHQFPTLVSASVPMSWTSYYFGYSDWVDTMKYTPIWNIQGGLDGAPSPFTSRGVRDGFLSAGANYTYTEYPDLGHGTWDRTWAEPDFWPFLKRAYGANPWALYNHTEFCPGETISATLGVADGFTAYEWRKDGVLIPGANSHTYTATQIGTYDLRVKRGNLWSEWSRIPVVIKIKGATIPPTITVSGLASRVLPALDGSTSVQLEVPAGFATYSWEKVGDPTVLSTTRTINTSVVGDYRVKVTEQFGCSSNFSAPITVVNANGVNKPDPAINLLATALSKSSIRLNWTDNPTPQFNETNFEIYQSTQSGGPYKFVGITGADVKTFTVNGLTPNTKFYFKVRAVNNTAAASASNEASGITQADSQIPTAPANLTVIGTTRSTISLKWDASLDDAGINRYEIFVNGVKSFATTNLQFTLSGVQYPNSYNISVRAVDLAENFSPLSNQVTAQALNNGLDYRYYKTPDNLTALPDFSTLVPFATGHLANVSITPKTQDLNYGFVWEGYISIPVTGTYNFLANSDDGSKIYLGPLNGNGSPYSHTATPLVNNDGIHGSIDGTSGNVVLQKGTYPIAFTYFQSGGGQNMNVFWITPQTNGNWSPIPDSAFVDKPLALGTAPNAPSNLTATVVNYKRVDLAWTDNSNNELGFEIWRSTNPNADYNTIATLPANTTTYKDTLVYPNTTYYYRVRAINLYGESAYDRSGPGVDYQYYEAATTYDVLPSFAGAPIKTGHVNNFGLGMQNRPDNFALKFTTTLSIPATGVYTFYVKSDDGTKLYIDGFDASKMLIDNDGVHDITERSGSKALSAGPHTLTVTYFDKAGGEFLSVQISGSGIPKQTIPISMIGTPCVSVVTSAPPAVPTAPTGLVATGSSKSSIVVSWNDNASNETKYELFRSTGTNAAYNLYATLPANTNSFTDNGLFANSVFYYKVRAVGTGNSTYTNEDSAKTLNTKPVIEKLPATRTARYGTSTVINIGATDADGDALTFVAENLPGFAGFVSNGNGTSTLTLNPTIGQQGSYNNIRVITRDPFGGADTTQFNLTVNANFDPVVSAISNYTIEENQTQPVSLSATDADAGDVITWSVNNLPSGSFTLTPGANGAATLTLKPSFAHAGVYTVQVVATDGHGGYGVRTFTLTVTDKYPNVKIYVRVKSDTDANFPWNNISSGTTTNLVDDQHNVTNVGINFPNGLSTSNTGPVTGDNSGVYPDAVLHNHYIYGAWWMGVPGLAIITGLDPARTYSLTLFGSSIYNAPTDNGTSVYTINGVSQNLNVQNNKQNTVTFNNVTPASNGTITINLDKLPNAAAGFLNSIVITSVYDDGTAPSAPTGLDLQNVSGGVKLIWNNTSYNTSSFEIERATNAAGPFAVVGTAIGADANNYTDGTVSGNTTYYYRVRGKSPGNLYSAYSNTASILTKNRVPAINQINSVTLKNNQTLNVNVTATDDAFDHITLTASGLPQFATFTDNGNGTGTISIQPLLSSVGVYRDVTITAKDNSDSSRSASFDITVIDKDVKSIYVNFTDGSMLGDKPWNNLAYSGGVGIPAGTSYNNLKDDMDSTWTSVNVTMDNGFTGMVNSGMKPNNGKEVYSPKVIRTGLIEVSSTTKTITVSGLDATKLYNFVFFASHDDGTTASATYSISGYGTVTLDAAYNINKTVQINGVIPVNGAVTVSVSKVSGNANAYLNAMVIQSYPATPAQLIAPTDLRVVAQGRDSIKLQWQDRSNNETGFDVYRAVPGGAYALVPNGSVGANVTSFVDRDPSLVPNKPYYYVVRARRNAAPLTSNYSNVATAYTYAYSIYVNFSNNYQGASPWNNLAAPPQVGYVWNNFRDEKGTATSVGMVETGLWAGIVNAGVNTGNNSGIFPDNVMIENYGLFPGQTATVKLTGLNLSMKYDLTFFGSSTDPSDVNGAYVVNGKTVMLNASNNKNGTVTMYDVVPDQYGELLITVSPGTIASHFGLLGAMIVSAYTPSSGSIPNPPGITTVSPDLVRTPAAPAKTEIANKIEITAFPNPFRQFFTLTVSTEEPDELDVFLYDINGRLAYQTRCPNVSSGMNTIRIQPDKSLPPGVYMVKAVLGNKDYKQIKIVRL